MRARDGEFAGVLGVMVAGAARAGKKGLACGPSVAAREVGRGRASALGEQGACERAVVRAQVKGRWRWRSQRDAGWLADRWGQASKGGVASARAFGLAGGWT